ncbi:MAG TPA: hypothetical protein ENN51_02725 [candidate division WOR-3 bacterium]|uniref:Polymerase/histidinol phosphatase N-terminal domain-containing protein n=1 Tax=candidate division WOR-3 bacterium TaxID=2052148 RepID=A0A7V0XEL1_UNCW3|nr:hypothetical protein [candidate division WOR-3 bacterium]
MLVPVSALFALVPMAGDNVVYDGPARFTDGTWYVDHLQLVGQPSSGLYVAVAEVEQFRVLLNDTLVATSRPGPTPRTIIRAIDLSNDAGRMRAGWNRIKLEATEPADSFTVRIWTSRHSWYLGSPHSHTTYSDGMLSVHDLLEWAERDGGHYHAITDHNTLDQCADTAFHRFGRLEPMRGTEWTNWDSGHANLLGIQGQEAVPWQGPIRRMIDEATHRGGRWFRYATRVCPTIPGGDTRCWTPALTASRY